MDTPAFDPSQPFDVVSGQQAQQPQMMSGAQQIIPPQRTPNLNAATPAPEFDPSKPFDVVSGPQPAPQNSLAGSGKALGTGLVNAASGLIGAPGDIWNLANRALGRGDDYGKTWGSEYAKKGIQKSFGIDKEYEPQTALERGIEKVGEYLPAAAFPMGDVSLGTKLLTAVGMPAAGSFAASEATRGTPYEPYASIAGGVLGGVAGSKIANMAAARNAAAASPMQNAAQLGKTATDVYQSPGLNGMVFKDAAVDNLQDTMRKALGNRTPALANGTHAIIDNLDNPANGQASTWADIHGTRTLLGQQAGKFADPIDQGAAVAAKKALDGWLQKMPQSYLQAGDTSEIKNFFTANTNYQVMSALNMLSGKEYAADLGAAAANSGMNFENAMRQRIKGILLSPTMRSQFENLPNGDQVISAMEDVVRGGKAENLLRGLSNVLGGGGGLHAGLAIGAAAFGHPGAALAPAAGWALKGIQNRGINNKLNAITQMVTQGAPANQSVLAARNALMAKAQQLPATQRALINAALSRGLSTQQMLLPTQSQ